MFSQSEFLKEKTEGTEGKIGRIDRHSEGEVN